MHTSDTGHYLSRSQQNAGPAAAQIPDEGPRATDCRPRASASPSLTAAPSIHRRSHTPSQPANAPNAAQAAQRPAHLKCISCNVQKSASNTTILLEKFCSADIICVQEIYWGLIKHIPSANNPQGEPYYNTVAHAHFLCLGASETSRVAVYVNRKWTHASPQLRSTAHNHRDIIHLAMRFSTGEFHLLNVYNDSRSHEAVAHLLQRCHSLPAITCMVGDFNLRHSMWDTREQHSSHSTRSSNRSDCTDLIQLATMELGLHLLNDPDGPPTWRSNNLAARPGVLDLVWVDPSIGEYDPLIVHLHDRTASDHAALEWRIPVSPEGDQTARIHKQSEAADEFLKDAGRAIAAIPAALDSPEAVRSAAHALRSQLDLAWTQHATIPVRCAHSKTWWNAECSMFARNEGAPRKCTCGKAGSGTGRGGTCH